MKASFSAIKNWSPGKKFGLILLIALFLLTAVVDQPVFAQDDVAELGLFESQQAAPGTLIQVPVSVRNVSNAYGVDFILEFDPAILQVEDADPNTSGVQALLGNFLDPGLLLFNNADNNAGTYRFAMSQVNPSEPKSGEGDVVIITFKALAAGESGLEISYVMFGDREGMEIPSTGVNSTLLISESAPTQAVTYEVVDSTAVIMVNTFTPTPTLTPTPLPTSTPKPTLTGTPVVVTDEGNDDVSEGSGASYWLVKNWWVVLVLLGVVIALVVKYLTAKKAVINKEEKNDENQMEQ